MEWTGRKPTTTFASSTKQATCWLEEDSDTLQGVRGLHELLAPHAEDPGEVIVGIEKERGLIVTALLGANYDVYALNPMSVARYRERHVTSGSKSDPGDAKVHSQRRAHRSP